MQLKLILSEEEKCYSIYHCKKCPELDICEKCSRGYILNEDKSKCIPKEIKSSASASTSFSEINSSKSSQKSSSKEKINISSSQKSSANKWILQGTNLEIFSIFEKIQGPYLIFFKIFIIIILL